MSQKMMRAAVYLGDCQMGIREVPVPEPGRGEVLIEMKRAAICGSDLHRYRRPKSFFEGKGLWIAGHEPSGLVVEVGEGCERVQVGDRVTVYHYLSCGHCEHCRAGYLQYCAERRPLGHPNSPGSDADYMAVDERNCLLLPDALTYEDGAFIACIAGTGFSAMRKLRPNGEDTVAVFGQGPVGLTGTVMAKALGARVIGVDLAQERLALSTALGADAVVDAGDGNTAETIRELTDGKGAEAALETSGSRAAHQSVIDCLAIDGRSAFVGFGSSEPSVNLTSIINRQLTLMGSFVMPISYYWDLVDFMLAHDLPAKFRRMTTHRFKITEATEAFRVANSGTAGKVMFVWD